MPARLGPSSAATALPVALGGTGTTNATQARSNLGLGAAAVLPIGTTTGSVAAGDDSRIVNALSTTAAAAGFTPLSFVSTIGTLSRTSAARASETANVLDFTGIDPTGTADSATAFNNAQGTNKLVVSIPTGDYKLGSNVFLGSDQSFEMSGVKFTGSGLLGDTGDWSPYLNRVTKAWAKKDTSNGNSFTTVTSMNVGTTSGTVSYEKAAGYDYIITSDASTNTTDKDAVARQMTATIRGGNMAGRVWGFCAQANVSTGADGAAAGGEIDVVNNGSDQPIQGTGTSKTGLGIIAFGSSKSTVALNVVYGSNAFYDGIAIASEAATRYPFRVFAAGSVVNNTFHVTPAGDVLANSLGTTGGKTVQLVNTTNAVNFATVQASSTGNAVNIGTAGGDASPSLNISPVGALYLGSGAGAINLNAALYAGTGTFYTTLVAPTVGASDNGGNVATTAFATRAIINANAISIGVSLLDYVVGGDASYSEALTRLIAAVSGNLRIRLPPGSYTFASAVTFAGGRSISIEGAGKHLTSITVSHSGTWLACTMTGFDQQVVLRGITAYASHSSGATALAIVTYPSAGGSSVTHPTLTVSDIEIRSTTGGTLPGTWLKGFVLSNVWIGSFSDITMQARFLVPGTSTSCLFDVSECIDIFFDKIELTYGDCMIYQTGYCEGMRFSRFSAIGSNYFMRQNTTNITRHSTYYTMIGLWLNAGEVNTQLGGIQADGIKDGFVAGMEWSQWAGVATNTAFVAFDLLNCQSFSSIGDVVVGGANPSVSTAVKLRYSSGSCSANRWTGLVCEDGCGIAADFGSGTAQNAITDMRKTDAATVTDTGTGNAITWRTQAGTAASKNGHVLAGSAGQGLVVVPDIAGAVNQIMLSGATTGNGPSVQPIGTDANISLVLTPKGTGQVYASGSMTVTQNLNVSASVIASNFVPTGGTVAALTIGNTASAVNRMTLSAGTTGNVVNVGTAGEAGAGMQINPLGTLYLNSGAGAVAVNCVLYGGNATFSSTVSAATFATSGPANNLSLAGATASNTPSITAGGTDANVSVAVLAKGQAGFVVNSGAGTVMLATPSAATTANYPKILSAPAGNSVTYTVAGSDTNANAFMTGKGAGLAILGGAGGSWVGLSGSDLVGFHGATAVAKQTVTGSRGGNAALASLLTALAAKGLITDSTSA